MGDSGQKIRILSQILEFLAQFLPEITPSGLTDTFDDALETTVRSAQQTLGRTVTGEVTPADWLAFYRAALSLGAVNPASAAPEPQEVWPGAALTLGSSGPAGAAGAAVAERDRRAGLLRQLCARNRRV